MRRLQGPAAALLLEPQHPDVRRALGEPAGDLGGARRCLALSAMVTLVRVRQLGQRGPPLRPIVASRIAASLKIGTTMSALATGRWVRSPLRPNGRAGIGSHYETNRRSQLSTSCGTTCRAAGGGPTGPAPTLGRDER